MLDFWQSVQSNLATGQILANLAFTLANTWIVYSRMIHTLSIHNADFDNIELTKD